MLSGAILGRISIKGVIVSLSGLHIGIEPDSAEIGGLDLPVIRDPVSLEPYIPGSSLKGKLRSLMERTEFSRRGLKEDFFNKVISSRNAPRVSHHECEDPSCIPCRLFGASKGTGVRENRPARLLVGDAFLTNAAKLSEVGTGLYSEIKMENSLDRITSAATPRKIERVLKGAEFGMSIVYNIEDRSEVEPDIEALFACLELLTDDYLGGGGSRGYGRVELQNISVEQRSLDYYWGRADSSAITPPPGACPREASKYILEKLRGEGN